MKDFINVIVKVPRFNKHMAYQVLDVNKWKTDHGVSIVVTESFLGPLTWIGISIFLISFTLIALYLYKNHKSRGDVLDYEFVPMMEEKDPVETREHGDKDYEGVSMPEKEATEEQQPEGSPDSAKKRSFVPNSAASFKLHYGGDMGES